MEVVGIESLLGDGVVELSGLVGLEIGDGLIGGKGIVGDLSGEFADDVYAVVGMCGLFEQIEVVCIL